MGRHSKPSTSSAGVAKLAITGAIIGSGSVALAAQAQAAPDSEWDVVARCESSGNWAINTGNGYHGGLQFSPSTWLGYGGGQFASAAYMATRDQQIAVAEKVLAGQGKGAWPTCGRGLSGPTPRNLTADPKPASPAADALDAAESPAPADTPAPLDMPAPQDAADGPAAEAVEPEIIAIDVVIEEPVAPAAVADPATPPVAVAPEVVAVDVVVEEPAQPANAAPEVTVVETDFIAPADAAAPEPNAKALEVISAATGDTPIEPSMVQEVSFLREVWQAMKDQNLSADDMLAAMGPAPA